jgi:hypothetical protein
MSLDGFVPAVKLALAAKFNEKASDATAVFMPEARAWANHWSPYQRIEHVDNRMPRPKRADAVIDAIVRNPPANGWDAIGFFCHGYPSGIQLGFDIGNVRDLARAIVETSPPNVVVALYCCSTASVSARVVAKMRKALGIAAGVGGDGGFADVLRDELCRMGATRCRVMGHTTEGKATKNPHVRFFDGQGSPIGGQGGVEVVLPSSRALWKRWRAELAREDSTLRYEMPHLSIQAIHERLVRIA